MRAGVLKKTWGQILSDTSFILPPTFYIPHKWFLPVFLVSLASVSLFLSVRPCLTHCRDPGANREVKKAVEAYWAGKISADDLTKAAAEVKKASWTSVKSKGVDSIPRQAIYH